MAMMLLLIYDKSKQREMSEIDRCARARIRKERKENKTKLIRVKSIRGEKGEKGTKVESILCEAALVLAHNAAKLVERRLRRVRHSLADYLLHDAWKR